MTFDYQTRLETLELSANMDLVAMVPAARKVPSSFELRRRIMERAKLYLGGLNDLRSAWGGQLSPAQSVSLDLRISKLFRGVNSEESFQRNGDLLRMLLNVMKTNPRPVTPEKRRRGPQRAYQPREGSILIRLTKEQRNQIKAAAMGEGVSVTEFCIKKILGTGQNGNH